MDQSTKELLAMIGIVAVIAASIIFIAWAIFDSLG